MTEAPQQLSDDVVELGYVRVSVGMGEKGRGASYKYEGLSVEEAFGYMSSVLEHMKLEMSENWEPPGFEAHLAGATVDSEGDITCDHCGESLLQEESEEDD